MAGLASAALIAVIGLAAAGWIAYWVPPLDLINNFLPILTAAGAIAILVLLVLCGWSLRRGLCGAALLAMTLPRLLSERPAPSTIPVPQRAFTLLQFNVLKDNSTPWAAAQWVLQHRPDVVTMEETLGSSRVILAGLRPLYPYQTSCLPHMRCSTVILSRERPIAAGGLASGDPENQKALSAAWATFNRGDRPFTVVAVHMVRPWPWGNQEPGRLQLAAFLNTIDRRRAIVAGDFNLTPWTAAMRHQDCLFRLERRSHGVATWPAKIGNTQTPAVLPIDHVYAGSDWRVQDIHRGPYLGSDHLPLLVSLLDRATAAPMSNIN